jgi:phosphoglycolate phosphatase
MAIDARRYDVIILDWDGTLMNSAPRIVAAMQAAIAGTGLPARSDEQIRELIGLGLDDALGRLFPGLDLESARAALAQYRQRFLAPPAEAVSLFPGVETALQQLDASGYRLAIATGKSRRGLDRELNETGLARLFGVSRCADECASKPDPQMLEEILWETGIAPERALMVGDTEYDISMAKAARIAGLGVACGVHSPGRLMAAGAHQVLSGVSELPDWLTA